MFFNRGSRGPGRPEPEMVDLVRSDERDRITRELHDSTSQLLVALQLQLGRLKRHGVPGGQPLLNEMEQLLREIQGSIKQVGSRPSAQDGDADAARVKVASLFYSLGSPHKSAG